MKKVYLCKKTSNPIRLKSVKIKIIDLGLMGKKSNS